MVKIISGRKYLRMGSALVTGATADTNIAIAGILTTDELLMVLEFATSTNDPTDQTANASITSDGNIQVTTATASDSLMVLWASSS